MKNELICVDDFKKIAQEKLDPIFWKFFAAFSGNGITYNKNFSDFNNFEIIPHLLHRSVGEIDSKVGKLLGGNIDVTTPISISPTAFHKYAHPLGEIATAKAAAKHGSVFIHSAWSSTTVEDLAYSVPQAILWQNIYIYENRNKAYELVRRAEKAGYQGIVVTVDIPVLPRAKGRTKSDLERQMVKAMSVQIKAANFTTGEELIGCRAGDPGATWEDFRKICQFTRLPVIAKGITTNLDAVTALEYGASAIIVSTHGGRQLDGMCSSIEALPQVVEAVGDKCDIFLDSGIRTGTEVFKALALGAKSVFIGRPALWGLAYKGEDGVYQVIDILKKELETTMALAGCASLADISSEYVRDRAKLRSVL